MTNSSTQLDPNIRKDMSVQYFVALAIVVVGLLLLFTGALAPFGVLIAMFGVAWWIFAWVMHKAGA